MPMKSREQIERENQVNEEEMQKLQAAINQRLAIREQYRGYLAAMDDAEGKTQGSKENNSIGDS